MESARWLSRFWDDTISAWLDGGSCVPSEIAAWFDCYRGTGRGQVDPEAFPEPYFGDLRSRPAAVVLALNPGEVFPEFQYRGGHFANEIRHLGAYSMWAKGWPYLREHDPRVTEGSWTQLPCQAISVHPDLVWNRFDLTAADARVRTLPMAFDRSYLAHPNRRREGDQFRSALYLGTDLRFGGSIRLRLRQGLVPSSENARRSRISHTWLGGRTLRLPGEEPNCPGCQGTRGCASRGLEDAQRSLAASAR